MGTRPGWIDDSLFPYQSHFVDAEGCEVHYVDEGKGPTLLLLHGNPTWSFLYRHVIAGLRDRFRCVAPDYPGFGLSRPRPGYGFTPREHSDVIAAFMDSLGLDQVTPMMQDWGGPIGLGVAVRRPERFRALVIGNTWAWPMKDLPTQAFSRLLGGWLGGILIRRYNIFVERVAPRAARRAPFSEQVMEHYREPFRTRDSREPTHVFPREILRSIPWLREIEAGLPALADHPALIVWGDADYAFREEQRRRWEQIMRHSRTVILEGAGHYIQEEAPEEIATAIGEWWGEVVEPS